MRKHFLIIALAITSLSSFQQKESKLVNKEISKIDFLQNLNDICDEDDGVFKNCDELFTKDVA